MRVVASHTQFISGKFLRQASLLLSPRKGKVPELLGCHFVVWCRSLFTSRTGHSSSLFSAGAIAQLAINTNSPSCLLLPEVPTEAHLTEAKVEDRSLSSRAALRISLALN